jgi:hypothetical protein
MLNAYVTLDPIETLYIASLLGDQRRPIDCYIDYFGGRRPHPEVSSSAPALTQHRGAGRCLGR